MAISGAAAPQVSVIIPTFNRAHLLPETLQSVLYQTFVDLEVLVVDDGSTDETEQIVHRLGDSRIIYIYQVHSGLPAVARNTGLRQARGKYIAFLDSDDLWLPEKLASQVEYMEAHPELGLTFTNAYVFRDSPEQSAPGRLMLRPNMALSGQVFDRLYGQPLILNLTVMLRASVIAEVGFFDEDPRLKANEDYEYWLRVAHRYPIGFIPRPFGKYRQHAEGISRAAVATNQAKLFLIEKLDRMYPSFVARHAARRRSWLSRVHYALGRGLLREHRVSEARHHLIKSLELRPRLAAIIFLGASFLGRQVYSRLDGIKARWIPDRSW
jgi:glycosyltransferase involved in cell wall biosynthesis